MNWNRKAASLTASTLAVLAAGGGIAFALADAGSAAPHTPAPAASSPADALATGDTASSTPPATDLPSSAPATAAATTSAAASTVPGGTSAAVPSSSAVWTPTKVPQSTGGYVTVTAQPASSTAGIPPVRNPKYTPSSWSGPGLTSVPTPTATSSG